MYSNKHTLYFKKKLTLASCAHQRFRTGADPNPALPPRSGLEAATDSKSERDLSRRTGIGGRVGGH